MGKPEDLTNREFGRLTVLHILDERQNGHVVWKCQCLCGNIVNVKSCHLKSKHTKSCGCFQAETSLKTLKNCQISVKINGAHGSRWNGVGDLYGSYFGALESGAKRRNMEFNISKEYIWNLFLKQNGKCKLSGLEIHMGY